MAHLTALPQESPGAISKAALSGGGPKASEAVDMFLSILGAEAGHLGLRLLAKGGVYICGGIAPKVTGDTRHRSVQAPRLCRLRAACIITSSLGRDAAADVLLTVSPAPLC